MSGALRGPRTCDFPQDRSVSFTQGSRLRTEAWAKNLAIVPQLAERWTPTSCDRANSGAPDVGEHEPPDTCAPRRALHRKCIEVSAHATAEADRSFPRRCLREHQIGAFCPRGKLEEFGCPHDLEPRAPDLVAERRMISVDDWLGLNPQISGAKRCDPRRQPPPARASADRRSEFGMIIREEPGIEATLQRCARSTIDDDASTCARHQQACRVVKWRAGGTDAEGHQAHVDTFRRGRCFQGMACPRAIKVQGRQTLAGSVCHRWYVIVPFLSLSLFSATKASTSSSMSDSDSLRPKCECR